MSGNYGTQRRSYRDQIRRIQTALRHASWADANTPAASLHSDDAWGNQQRTALEESDAPPSTPPSAPVSHLHPFRQRDVNVQAQSKGAQSYSALFDSVATATGTRRSTDAATSTRSPLPLFASAVASTHPFEDLITMAWGGCDRTWTKMSASVPECGWQAVPQARTMWNASLPPSPPPPLLSASSAASAVSVSSSTSSISVAAEVRCVSDLRPVLCALREDNRATQPAVQPLSGTTEIKGRHTAAQSNRTVSSVIAACTSASLSDVAHKMSATIAFPSDTHAEFHPTLTSSSGIAETQTAHLKKRESNRVAAFTHCSGNVTAMRQPSVDGSSTSRRNAAARQYGARQRSAHPSAQRQRQQHQLLTRIQQLDRVLELCRGGRSSAETLRLLSLVKDDNNKPFFAAGPVNWSAVRRLREQLVTALLAKSGDDGEEGVARQHLGVPSAPYPPPSPSVTLPCDVSCRARRAQSTTWCAVDDAEAKNATKVRADLPLPSSLSCPTPPSCRPHAEEEDCGATPASQPAAQGPSQVVDDYAASRADFQREGAIMRRAQERLRQRCQASAGLLPS
jgi:hypothetical protein